MSCRHSARGERLAGIRGGDVFLPEADLRAIGETLAGRFEQLVQPLPGRVPGTRTVTQPGAERSQPAARQYNTARLTVASRSVGSDSSEAS